MERHIELIEKYYVLNSSVLPVEGFSYNYSAEIKILYEVIRVKDSTPIFFDKHLERLWKSIKLSGLSFPDKKLLTKMFLELLRLNPVVENNIRISLVYQSESIPDLLIYFIPSTYPSPEQLANGVLVKTINASRENPNIKIENKELRVKADEMIKSTGCYEVVLVGNNGLIAEGSRSNLFFIKDKMLITPPIGMVLGGITRQMVINLCSKLGITVKEEKISAESLANFDAAFITGTSPSVLPIKSIDEYRFNVSLSTIKSLIVAYNELVNDDIMSFRSNYGII